MLLDKIIEYKAYFIKKSSVHLSSICFELHVKFLIFLLCKAFIVLVLQFLGIIHTFNLIATISNFMQIDWYSIVFN